MPQELNMRVIFLTTKSGVLVVAGLGLGQNKAPTPVVAALTAV